MTFVFIWVATENFGGILAGGATDPNSGPLVIILALTLLAIDGGSKGRDRPAVELLGRLEGGSRPMTPTPAWLYYLFAVAMLAVAAYGFVLLAVSVAIRRSAGWDVDIAHLFMGVSMAGMFVTDWAFGPTAIWELIFAVLLVWFLVQSIQSVIAFGIHLTHYLIHAAMSFAMLLMYVFPAGAGSRAMSMSMAVVIEREDRSGARLAPRGRVLRVRHFHAGLTGQGRLPSRKAFPGLRHERVGRREQRQLRAGQLRRPLLEAPLGLIAAPWLEDASHVVMCIGMGFMLILMI